MTDWELLRQYRENRSNEAFRKLAERHMKLVYSTCRRDLDSVQAAEDATQLVFILLARRANAISRAGSVSSWLFGAARFVCKDMVKSEMRRRRREEAAFGMEQAKSGNEEWDEIEPQLNDALTSLMYSDREAVLMRYYDGMSLQEIAREIGTTEDTARKRVSRAVDKLRGYFQREHATAQFLSLDTLLVAYATHLVPTQTHTAVMSTLQNLGAAHGAPAALNSQAGVLLKKGAIVLMDATTKKVLIGIAVVAVIAASVGIPMMAAHARFERLAAQDTAAVIDSAPEHAQAAAGANQNADRQAILANMRESLNQFRSRDLSHWQDTAVPSLVVNMPGQPNMTMPQVIQMDQTDFFPMAGPFRITDTIRSMQIQGDSAVVQLDAHIEGITQKYKNIPAGLKLVSDQNETDTWHKESGRWLTTRVDLNSMRTALNGQVVMQLPKPSQTAVR